jgi:hypothetical protein
MIEANVIISKRKLNWYLGQKVGGVSKIQGLVPRVGTGWWKKMLNTDEKAIIVP